MAAPGANGIVKYAHLIRTRKYVAVISMDNRGGSYFSVTGWSTFIDRKEATPQWIGENLMKALQTSKDLFMEWGKYPLPQDKIDAERKRSGPLYMEFWGRVREKYGFKDWRQAQTKSAPVLRNGNVSRRTRSIWPHQRGGEQVTLPGIRTKTTARSFMPRSMPVTRSLARSACKRLTPASPTTRDAQLSEPAICKAIQRAKDRIAADPDTSGKDNDFAVKVTA